MFKYKKAKMINDITVENGKITGVDLELDVDIVDHSNYWGLQNYLKNKYAEFVPKKKFDITTIKTIHFTPACDVSREKLKSLLQKHNVKVIRDSSKADVIITSVKYFVSNLAVVKNSHKIQGFEDANKQKQAFVNPHHMNDLIGGFVSSERENDILNSISNQYFSNRNSWSKSFFDLGGAIGIIRKSDLESNPIFTGIVNPDGNVYDQQVILDLMGETVIDREAFEGLKSMLESTDTSNHTVAVTIMANCNYQKSLVYLLQLCRLFHNRIWDNPVRKTVAFKGFTNYLGSNMRYQLRFDYDNIFNIVIAKDAVTQDTIDYLYELGAEEFSSTSDYIELSSYKFSDKAMKKLQSKLKTDDGFPSGGEVLQQEVSVQLQQPEQTDVCAEHFL